MKQSMRTTAAGNRVGTVDLHKTGPKKLTKLMPEDTRAILKLIERDRGVTLTPSDNNWAK